MKSRKLLAVFLVAALFSATVTQTVFAAEYWTPINKEADVPSGNITIEQPVTGDGIYGVMPEENITLKGDLTITVPSSESADNRVVGVNNESTETNDFTVQTKNIVIQAADSVVCTAIGVSAAGGKTIVDGNITADTYGIEYSDGTVICTGTVQGGTSAIAVTSALGETQSDSIVVYELKGGTGSLITFTGDVGGGEPPTEDALLSRINYIIKKDGAADKITLSGGVRQVEGYDTAHSGDTITIKLASGYTFGSDNTVTAVQQADGTYLVTVPRGGGVTLSAILAAVYYPQPAPEDGSSTRASAKQYTEEQLNAAIQAYGGVLVSTYSELARALAEGKKVLFVTNELMSNTKAQKQLFYLLKAGSVNVYKVMDDGAIMSAAVKDNQMEYTNCGNVITAANPSQGVRLSDEQAAAVIAEQISKSREDFNTGIKIDMKPEETNPAMLHAQSASALFTNDFTKTAIKEAGIERIVLKNDSLNVTVPVDNLTNGGNAKIEYVQGNGTEGKLVADNIAVPSLTEEGAGGTAIGQENIQVNIVNSKAGNSRLTIKLPGGKGTGAVNLKVNGITLNHGEADTNNDGTWLPVETYSIGEGGAYTYYIESTDGT